MAQCYPLDVSWVGPRAGLFAVEKKKTSAPATRIKFQLPCNIAHSLLFILTVLFQLIQSLLLLLLLLYGDQKQCAREALYMWIALLNYSKHRTALVNKKRGLKQIWSPSPWGKAEILSYKEFVSECDLTQVLTHHSPGETEKKHGITVRISPTILYIYAVDRNWLSNFSYFWASPTMENKQLLLLIRHGRS